MRDPVVHTRYSTALFQGQLIEPSSILPTPLLYWTQLHTTHHLLFKLMGRRSLKAFGPVLGYLKVSKSQKQNWRKKLIPKTNGRICFSILTVQKYLKLEIKISSFRWFRTVRIEKQIHPLVLEEVFSSILLLRFIDL